MAGVAAITANYVSDWQKDSVRSTNGNATIWGQKAKVINAMFTVPGKPGKALQSIVQRNSRTHFIFIIHKQTIPYIQVLLVNVLLLICKIYPINFSMN